MIKKLLMAASVLLVIMAVIYLSARSHVAETIFTDILRVVIFGAIIGGSIYKLAQWWRYRHDPRKREQAASLSQVYPARLRRFIYDEEDDKAKRD
jgi:hypothetical protein